MKYVRFLVILLCLLLVLGSIMVSVFASELPVVTTEASETQQLETQPATQPSQPINITVQNNSSELELVSFSTSVVSLTADNTTGFKSVILGLFGPYEMVTKEYTYQNQQGYTTKQVTTESDYAWMISAGIFTVVLYCLFRLLGGALCGRK